METREAELDQLVATGSYDRATEIAIRTYGDELVDWLCRILPPDDAADAFSWLCVELWRSLRRFDGRCSFRTWCYVLARHAVARIRRSLRRYREILVPCVPEPGALLAGGANDTLVDAVLEDGVYAEIRARLDADARELLELRIDKNLAWADIAQAQLGERAGDQAAVRRRSAALRKQFERVKGQLKQLAREELRD